MQLEKAACSNKDPMQPKINKLKIKKKTCNSSNINKILRLWKLMVAELVEEEARKNKS